MTALEDLTSLIDQLVSGWRERIEFAIDTQQHTADCVTDRQWLFMAHPGRLKHHTCACPKARELRAENRTQRSLLQQLAETAYHVPQNGSSSGGSGSVNKPESKIPGNLAAPDELIRRLIDTAYGHGVAWGIVYSGRVPANTSDALRQLAVAAPNRDPEDLHQLIHDLRPLVHAARVLLGYDSQTVEFADTSCGNCGGLLRVTRDIDQRTEVRCAGTPAHLPCGQRYPWHTWIALLTGAANAR